MTLLELQANSASTNELVLSLPEAIAALGLLEQAGDTLLGWEGWLRGPDGRLRHSARHQGTVDLSHLSRSEAYAFAKSTMQQSQAEHDFNPEVPASELLFCITGEA
jgi:hypothetical protein